MKVVLLDTETGERKDCSHWLPEPTVFWWTQGNGSCDCNRALAFGGGDLETEHRCAQGLDENICFGCRRWRVVAAAGDLEGYSEAEVIKLANEGYP